MQLKDVELLTLNTDDNEIENVSLNFDSTVLNASASENIYVSDIEYSSLESHSKLISSVQNYSSKTFSIPSDPIPVGIVVNDDTPVGGALGAAGSGVYMLTEHWGHEYATAYDDGYYFTDAEKHPGTDDGDDLLCWAGSGSNVLQWGGWANGVDDGAFEKEQDVLDYFAAHWTDDGGWMEYGWEWWITGEEPAESVDREVAHVDVAGAGFFPTISIDSVIEGTSEYSLCWDSIVEHLDAGYGVNLGIFFYYEGFNLGGHAITAWGYEESGGVKYVYYSDSDDDRTPDGGAAAPDVLSRSRVSWIGDTYELIDYHSDPDIATVLAEVQVLKQFDSDMVSLGTETFADAKEIAIVIDGESRRGNVDRAGDEDYYFINVATAGYITLTVAALTSADVDFYVYNAAEGLVASALNSDISLGFIADAGKYYIMVKGISSQAGGTARQNTYILSFGADSDFPSIPGGLTETVTGNDLALDWNDSTDGSGIQNYQVQVSSNEDFEVVEDIVGDTLVTDSEGTFDDLEDGTYFWHVKSQDNADNWSEWSDAESFIVDTTPPTTPVGLKKGDDLPDEPGGDTLTWDVSTDINGSGIRRYIVECATQADLSDKVTIITTDNKVSLSELPITLTYHWRVRAMDNIGNLGEWSDQAEITIEDDIAPSVPIGMRRVINKFAWNVATDDRSGVKEYVVEYSVDADFVGSDTITATTNEILIAALGIDASTYYWRVKTIDISLNESEWSEKKIFTATDASGETILDLSGSYESFGSSVSISGNNIVVAADAADASSKAHVYLWNESSLTYDEYSLDGSTGGDFVLISGDDVIVGGQRDDDNGTDAGATYAYIWNGTSYDGHKLTALDGSRLDSFGSAVSISEGNVVAGVCGDDDNGANSGSAYVFRQHGSSYEEYKLGASDGARHDNFGSAVFISGESVYIGAYQDDNDNGEDAGSLYIYNWNEIHYEEITKVTASDGEAGDNFGISLSSDSLNIVVGADKDDDNGSDSGSVYVYRSIGEYDYTEYKLTASDGSNEDYFGYSVSISGDYVAVGAYNDDDNGIDSGSVYLYKWNGETSSYNEIRKIVAENGNAGDKFGYSVSISGHKLVAGTNSATGGAYVYEIDNTAVSNDFGGDGKSDILFCKSDGSYLGYYLDASAAGWTNVGGVSAGWEVIGIGDFDANGQSDILFTNTAGTALGYYADGTASGWTNVGGCSNAWEVVGIGDFDGNGQSDILFSNLAGTALGYYADGSASGWTNVGGYSNVWEVIGVGDFDGNGQSDILFSNSAGTALGYYADGSASGWTNVVGVSAGWEIVGIGDFDGNGKDDILLTDATATSLGYYADGNAGDWVNVGTVTAGWSVAGIGDFDGSGMADILFTNATGTSLGYYADGLPSSWTSVGGYSNDWEVVVA